jgi:hypothetical protein
MSCVSKSVVRGDAEESFRVKPPMEHGVRIFGRRLPSAPAQPSLPGARNSKLTSNPSHGQRRLPFGARRPPWSLERHPMTQNFRKLSGRASNRKPPKATGHPHAVGLPPKPPCLKLVQRGERNPKREEPTLSAPPIVLRGGGILAANVRQKIVRIAPTLHVSSNHNDAFCSCLHLSFTTKIRGTVVPLLRR